MKLDKEALEEYGVLLLKLKMFPYFDMAHYILMCVAVREDIHLYQTTIPNFHKRHPLACYLSSMLLCFGGGILVHFLLGEPLLEDFKTHQSLALASICWYLVFFSPFDLFYKLVKFLPIKIILSVCKELQRSRKIVDGVHHGMHLYPNSYVIIVLVGALKGAGSGFLSIVDRFNRGFYLPNSNEILHPSFASKGCLVASLLFTLEKKSLITVPKNILFLSVVIFFSYVKIMSIFFKSFDPFVPFENLSAAVFFGGIIDAFKRARKPTNIPPVTTKAAKDANSELSKVPSADPELKKNN